MEGASLSSLFTPIGMKPTILFPGTNGGANWGGASFDLDTRTLYVNSMDVGMLYQMVKRPEGSEIPYRPRGSGTPDSRFWDQKRYPCQKPPWGHLTAIDLDKGEFRRRELHTVQPSATRTAAPSVRPLPLRSTKGGAGRLPESINLYGLPPDGEAGDARDQVAGGVARRCQTVPIGQASPVARFCVLQPRAARCWRRGVCYLSRCCAGAGRPAGTGSANNEGVRGLPPAAQCHGGVYRLS